MKARYLFFRILIGIVFSIYITSCSLVKPVEVIGINDFKVADKSGAVIQINTSLKLYNPNRLKLTIVQSDIDVYVEEVYMGKLQIVDPIEIPGKQNFNADLTLSISLSNLIVGGKSVLNKIKSGKFQVEFKGSVSASYRNISRTIQIENKQQVQLK